MPAPYPVNSDDALRFIKTVVEGTDAPKKYSTLAAKLNNHLGVDCRYSIIPDYLPNPTQRWLYPKDGGFLPLPLTSDRMAIYERESVGLAAKVAKAALEESQCDRQEITHLIISTCTGFFAPGPDLALVRHLELNSSVRRTIIGFMGCYAGFTGMRLAHEIVQSNKDAVVLQVAIELCSLHFQVPHTRELLLSNYLFGDGASAAVWRYGSEGLLGIRGLHSSIAEHSSDQMSWRIGDHGFVMHLASQVPKTLMDVAPGYLMELLKQSDISRDDISHWAIHPGGPAILRAIGQALDIPQKSLDPSFDVLRDYGNMSSATIFFVLKSLMKHSDMRNIVSMGFGPGLTMEGIVFDRGSNALS